VKILKSQSGFTLIELVAVIAVTGILLTIISALFVQIVGGNVRATVSNDIRENGQFIMEQIVRSLRVADIVTGSGKVTTLQVTASGTTDTYAINCGNLTKNGEQMNTSKIVVDSSCNASPGASYFNVSPASGSAPPTVQIVLVLKTTGSPIHTEYIGSQSFTQLVELRNYVR